MVLDRLYAVDRISSSCRYSGKQFVISISCKMELTGINWSPSLWKWIGMIYFDDFFICLSDFSCFFAKKILRWDKAIFFGNCYVVNFEMTS